MIIPPLRTLHLFLFFVLEEEFDPPSVRQGLLLQCGSVKSAHLSFSVSHGSTTSMPASPTALSASCNCCSLPFPSVRLLLLFLRTAPPTHSLSSSVRPDLLSLSLSLSLCSQQIQVKPDSGAGFGSAGCHFTLSLSLSAELCVVGPCHCQLLLLSLSPHM
jgi:hypothetical protein